MTGDEREISIFVCRGANSKKCRCQCPDSCEHEWDGPWKKDAIPFGDGECESVTCSRCGMTRIDHDLWAGP